MTINIQNCLLQRYAYIINLPSGAHGDLADSQIVPHRKKSAQVSLLSAVY